MGYGLPVRLEQLAAEHRDAILAFETVNRDYFAAFVTDRGDDFFAEFPARYAELLELQDAGTDRFHVLVTDDGTIAGRINLFRIADGVAELGYRIGRAYAGRGVATAGVRQVCERAASEYGLHRLRAVTTLGNHASQAILRRNGFAVVGPTQVAGQAGLAFRRDLRTVPGGPADD